MSLLLACTFVLAQSAAGAVWWLALRHTARMSWAEVIGMGVALGSLGSLLAGVALRPVLGAWGWAVPALVTLVFVLVRPRWIATRLRMCALPGSHLVALVVGVGAGMLVVIANWIRVPLDAVSDGSYADIYFFEALSRSVTTWGPGPSILMTGSDLPYHWFVYGWSGQLAATAGTPPFLMLTRVLPVVAVIALVALAIAWTTTTRATPRSIPRWVPTLAALLVVFAGYPGALYGSIVNFDSPSQTFASIWLLAFGLTILRFLHGGSRWLLPVIAVLGLSLVGGKVSHAAVAAAGLVVVTAVGVVRRAPWARRSGVVLVVAAVAMVVAYLWVLQGAALDQNLTETVAVKASTWQGLDPLVGRWGPVLGTLGLIAAMLARPAGLLALLGRKPFRDDPAVLWALGGLLAGLGALLVLREGINETWFFLAASAPAGALSAVGAGVLARDLAARGLRHPLGVAIAVTVPVSLVILAATWNWPIDPDSPAPRLIPWFAAVAVWILAPLGAWIALRLRTSPAGAGIPAVAALAVLVIVVSTIATRPSALWTTTRPVITDIGIVIPQASNVGGGTQPSAAALATEEDRRAALAWLEDTANANDVVATTRPTSAQIPAETGLRTFLSGQIYQAGLGPAGSAAEVDRRAALVSELASTEWAPAIAELCAAGVTYFWVEGDAPVLGAVNPAFTTPSVAVFGRDQVC
jgi:hypothetical protein